MSGKVYLQSLRDRQVELKEQISKLQGELAGLEFSIRKYEAKGADIIAANENPTARKQRIPIKYDVLTYLQNAKENGLIADEAVTQSGGKYNRASVSSLLSRLKGAGVATLANDRYYLVEYAPKQSATQIPASSSLN